MTITRALQPIGGALVAAVLIAGCGGGAQTTGLPHAVASATPVQGTQQPTTSATRVMFTIHRAGTAASAARRSPRYVSPGTLGLQITISASGAKTVTDYYDLSSNGPNCTYSAALNADQCSIVISSIATSENLSLIEVDAAPDNVDAATGQGTGFPQSTHVLALGSVTGLAVPVGTTVNATIPMDPVTVGFGADTGNVVTNPNPSAKNIAIDGANSRIVVTANAVVTAKLAILGDIDYDGYYIATTNASGGGQPFVDVNGSPTPITAQVNTTSGVKIAADIVSTQSPAPGTVLGYTATFPSTLYDDGALHLDFSYDGTNVATSGGGPARYLILLSNNLSASPPTFDGGSQGGYAGNAVYQIVPVDANPATLHGQDRVAGYDFGSANGLNVVNSTCAGSWTITPLAVTNGLQNFNVTQTGSDSGGACSFALADPITGVVTRTVTELGLGS